MSATPFYVDARTGWRVWGVRRDNGEFVLSGTVKAVTWPPGRPAEAQCLTAHGDPCRPAPGAECRCGLYAWHSPAPALGQTDWALGAVWLWGRVQVHEAGLRAQFAYPRALWLRCSSCGGRPDVCYYAPVSVAAVFLYCRACRTRRAAAWLTAASLAADVARELWERYGVPVCLGTPPATHSEALLAAAAAWTPAELFAQARRG